MDLYKVNYGLVGCCILLGSWLGVALIAKIPSQLHTPLMSGTNAISGITLVGALVALSRADTLAMEIFCYLGIFFAIVNVVGGYKVTDRMLKMFKKK